VRISRTIDLKGPVHQRVHYVDHGGRGVPIVLVHGLGGSSETWMGVAPALTEVGHVLALDLPGFGRTPLAEDRVASIEGNVELVDRFISEVTGGPAVLVGNSMGAMTSTFEATEHPENVVALVLIDPAVPHPEGTPVDPAVEMTFTTYAMPNGEELVANYIQTMTPAETVRAGMQLSCFDVARVAPEVVAAHVELQTERRRMAWANRALVEAARSLMETNAVDQRHYEAIKAVTVPTLLMHGEHDRLIPLAAAMAVAGLRPDWDFEILDGVGHAPQLEDPTRVASVVSRWLARLGELSDAKA
jgi:pimeloyl-ACP methyl ester carboxylesterase